jgi:hypothetical protein
MRRERGRDGRRVNRLEQNQQQYRQRNCTCGRRHLRDDHRAHAVHFIPGVPVDQKRTRRHRRTQQVVSAEGLDHVAHRQHGRGGEERKEQLVPDAQPALIQAGLHRVHGAHPDPFAHQSATTIFPLA